MCWKNGIVISGNCWLKSVCMSLENQPKDREREKEKKMVCRDLAITNCKTRKLVKISSV